MKYDYCLILYDSIQVIKGYSYEHSNIYIDLRLEFKKDGLTSGIRFGFGQQHGFNGKRCDVLFFVNVDGMDIKVGGDLYRRTK